MECTEGALAARVRACKAPGEHRVEWTPTRRCDRAAARESARLRATLFFSCEAAARAVLEALGGGLRGHFRVERPAWASQPAALAEPLAAAAAAASSLPAHSPQCHVCVRLSATREAVHSPVHSFVHSSATREHGGEAAAAAVLVQLTIDPPPPPPLPPPPPPPPPAAAAPAAPHRRTPRRPAARQTLWTAEHDALAEQLLGMGFGRNAARRASLRVLGAVSASPAAGADGADALFGAALDWLMSNPEGADDPLDENEGADGGCDPGCDLGDGGCDLGDLGDLGVPPTAAHPTPAMPPAIAPLPATAQPRPAKAKARGPSRAAGRARQAAPTASRWAALLLDDDG